MKNKMVDLKNKTILLTGIAGFIGSNCVTYLVKKYPQTFFIGIDKISYCSDFRNFQKIMEYKNFKFIKCDLKKIKKLKQIFTDHKIHIIIHLAAYTHVDISFANSIKFTKNNVLGTHNLAECAKYHNIDLFVHISTDEVYGSKDCVSDENSILDPTNPYAATKAAAEHILKAYYKSFKLPLIITRGNNVYGPKQYPDKVIPLFILNLLKEKKCKIHGTGKQTRSFLYVKDCVKAIETVVLKGKIGEIYNIGSKDEYSINEIAEKIINKIKPKEKVEDFIIKIEDRKFNDIRYLIDITKLKNLGWEQEVNFEKGLEKTINWYSKRIKRWAGILRNKYRKGGVIRCENKFNYFS